MTVCIAALCPVLNCVMCAFDMLISSATASAEAAMKLEEVRAHGAEWLILFSGYAPRFRALMERVKGTLAGGSLQDLITALETSYQVEILKRIETEILLQYGCSREDFIANGRQQFGDVRFNFLLDKIDDIDLEITLMAVGFDGNGAAHLLEVNERGVVTRVDQVAYHAIGTGRSAAVGTLHQNAAFSYGADLGTILFRLCAAKFAAENAPAVGQATFAVVAWRGGSRLAMAPGAIDKLREVWWREGSRPVPADALKIITENLGQPTPPAGEAT